MSLDWNYRSVGQAGQDMIKAAWIGPDAIARNPALDAVIWATMAIGVGNWTAANMPKVKARYAIYQALCGAAIKDGEGRSYRVTAEELDKLQGFHTNVSLETDAAFMKKAMGWAAEGGEDIARGFTLQPTGAFARCAELEAERMGEDQRNAAEATDAAMEAGKTQA